MDEFESYFESLNVQFDSWSDLLESENIDIIHTDGSEYSDQNVRLLPRENVSLYGIIPKMEKRSFSSCKECKHVFNPKDALLHKNCSLRGKTHLQQTQSKKKIRSKKKLPIPLPPLFVEETVPLPVESSTAELPPNSIYIVNVSGVSVVAADVPPTSPPLPVPALPIDVGDIPLPSASNTAVTPSDVSTTDVIATTATSVIDASLPTTTTTNITNNNSTSNSNSGSKNKKSRKTTKLLKEFHPEPANCGVTEVSKGACTRSITCSNHRIQLRKMVGGRTEDITKLIAERKAPKLKEENFRQITTLGPEMPYPKGNENKQPPITKYVPIKPKISENELNGTKTTSNCIVKTNLTEPITVLNHNKNRSTGLDGYFSQSSSHDIAVPVAYLPMSPVSAVTPLQVIQRGDIVCIEPTQPALSPPICPQSVYFTIPEQLNVQVYKSHPKPATLPTYGARKLGGAIVLSKQRLERQRNDILMAINTKRKPADILPTYKSVSLLNSSHRPNILKTKTNNKINLKKSAVDKIVTNDAKHIRLMSPDVNGFILHADVSEGAEAPQNNIHDNKISLLNIK